MSIKEVLQLPYSGDIEGFIESEYCIILENIFDKLILFLIFSDCLCRHHKGL